MSGELCTDNRFELISHYKNRLLESTNIETSPEEMAVIDNILFRFWQMGWLTVDVDTSRPESTSVRQGYWKVYSVKDCLYTCSECHSLPKDKTPYCPICGAKMRNLQ